MSGFRSRAMKVFVALAVVLAPMAVRAENKAFPEAGQGAGGASGFGRIVSAIPAQPGVWRAGVRGSFFQGSLIPDAGSSRQLGGELALGWGVADGLELFGSYRNGSTATERANPALLLVQGDVALGARGSVDLGGFALGGELRGEIRTGGGSDIPALDGSNVLARALASRAFETPFGRLVAHANLGAALGKSTTAMTLDSALLFGAGLSGYHRLLAGAGAEWHLGPATPFVSFDLDAPLGLASSDPSTFSAAAKRFTLGARVPVAAAGAIDVALDLGAGEGAKGFARTAPYAVSAGFSYAFDTSLYALPTPPPAPPAVTTGQVRGTVLDAATGKPVANAVVSVVGSGDAPVAADAKGEFTGREHAFGPVQLHVEREGFQPATADARLEAGQGAPVLVRLAPIPPPPPPPAPAPPPPSPPLTGLLVGHLEGASGNVSGRVVISGPRALETRFDQHGKFSCRVPPGTYEVDIFPDAHVAKRQFITVAADDAAVVVARLEPKSTPAVVTVEGDRLVLARPLALDEKSAAIADADRLVLAEIADLLVREPNRKLSIAVHADPAKSPKDDRVAWTTERADALRDAIVAYGVSGDRVAAEGLGFTQPIVPLKAKDRAKNRRVEFKLSTVPAKAAATVSPSVPSLNELPDISNLP